MDAAITTDDTDIRAILARRAAVDGRPPRPLDAVLFDLDDTLFDHRGAARQALQDVYAAHPCFASIVFEDFQAAHAAHLEALHHQVLSGVLDIDRARIERFRRLFEAAGEPHGDAGRAAAIYRDAYVAARRGVRGARELLARLRGQVRIAIVSNNLLAEQRAKLERCDLADSIDALVVSEEVGVTKPDPRIFHEALRRVGASPRRAVMVGDAWATDIAGAHDAGLAAVWFNPDGVPAPPRRRVVEIRSLEPAAAAIAAIVTSHADRD